VQQHQQKLPPLPTMDALQAIGVPHRVWRSGIDRGWFTSSPVAHEGNRAWGIDELVCCSWYYSLYAAGMKRPMAGELAGLLQEAMITHLRAETLNVYAWSDGYRGRLAITTDQPPEARGRAEIIFVIPVVT
jgi:hypothetical protein